MQNSFVYTVTQVNNYSSELLKKKLSNIWVEGEISSLKIYPSGYAYFILKDLKSELSCLTFARKIDNIYDGMKITVNGNIDLYTIKGKYQLKVSSIFTQGEGELWKEYVLLKNKLEKDGLFDRIYKQEIPRTPKNIGIISSMEGAVIHDICNILNRRAPYVNIIIKDTKVNGKNASSDLSTSLDELILYNKIDIIIIARGGGSFEDLSCFNDEIFVRKIFDCTIPIISAIGHETDFTLCDFVSDLRASTPSEAAELSCIDINDMKQLILNKVEKIILSVNRYILKNNLIMNNYSKLIKTSNIKNILIQKDDKNKYLIQIINNIINNKIEKYSLKLDANSRIIKSNNIKKLKKMGFSILRKNNKLVRNIKNINVNDLVNVELFKGNIDTKVRKINEK